MFMAILKTVFRLFGRFPRNKIINFHYIIYHVALNHNCFAQLNCIVIKFIEAWEVFSIEFLFKIKLFIQQVNKLSKPNLHIFDGWNASQIQMFWNIFSSVKLLSIFFVLSGVSKKLIIIAFVINQTYEKRSKYIKCLLVSTRNLTE